MNDPFADQITIKLEPELRHALAHLWYAIEALANGRKLSTLNELHSIESLIFFDGDEDEYEVWFQARKKEIEKMVHKKKQPRGKTGHKGKKTGHKGKKDCKGKPKKGNKR